MSASKYTDPVFLTGTGHGSRLVNQGDPLGQGMLALRGTFDDRWHKRLTVALATGPDGRTEVLFGPSVDMRPETLTVCGLQRILSEARRRELSIDFLAELQGFRVPATNRTGHAVFEDQMLTRLQLPCEQCCAQLKTHARDAKIVIPTETGYSFGTRANALELAHGQSQPPTIMLETENAQGRTNLHLLPRPTQYGIGPKLPPLGYGEFGIPYEPGSLPPIDRLIAELIPRLETTEIDVSEQVSAGLLANGQIVHGTALSTDPKNLNQCGESVVVSSTRLLTSQMVERTGRSPGPLVAMASLRIPQHSLTDAQWEVVPPCGVCCSMNGMHASQALNLLPGADGEIRIERAGRLIFMGEFPDVPTPPLSFREFDALAALQGLSSSMNRPALDGGVSTLT